MSSNSFIFCGVATFVTLVAMWAGWSRLHWFWRACVLEGVLALFLPVKAHEPLLFFLVTTPLIAGGVAWLESRRSRKPEEPRDNGAPPAKVARQFSLAEAFLLLALIGGLCGLGSAAVRGGVVMDWRALPVSAAVFASIAVLCYRISAFPGGLSHYWALALTGVIGAGILLWFGTQSLQVILPSHATGAKAIVSVWAVCLLLAGMCYFVLRFGNPRHLVALAGLIYVAVRIERDTLQDWMSVADMLNLYRFGRRTDIELLTLGYSLLVLEILLGVAVFYTAFSATAAAWKKWLARGAALCLVAPGVYWLSATYVGMLATTPFPETSFVKTGDNPLEKALPLVDEFYAIGDLGGFDPKNYPKAPLRHRQEERVAEVYVQLLQELQQPGWAPFDMRSGPECRATQDIVLRKLMGLSSLVETDFAQAEKQQDFAAAFSYALAEVQLYSNLQREGLMMHRSTGGSVLHLGAIRNQISLAEARQALTALRRIERDYEDMETTMQREQAWEEQSLNWRGRLGRLTNRGIWIVYGGRGYSERAFKNNDDTKHTWFRMLLAELALRLYHQERGRYPRQLDELVPEYLDGVPIDPFSDMPLVYRLQGEKYHLSSVWANHIDDQTQDQDLDACIESYRRSVASAIAAAKAAAKGPAKTSAPPQRTQGDGS